MPTTPNRKFQIPNTGADVGTWGSNDLNPNFSDLDNILGSVLTLNLAGSGTPVALTDTQQKNAILRFTGIMTGNVQITVSEPAYWICENLCSGNFNIFITNGVGESICPPQGWRGPIFFDGANVRFVNLGFPGTLLRLCASAVPTWIGNCTVNPYLPCIGGTASIATYPMLAALLGTTFGNPGGGLFSLPDLRGRDQFDLDAGAGRLTVATMTPDGNTLGATGGAQNNTILAGNVPVLAFAGTQQTWNLNQTDIAHGALTLANTGSGGGTSTGLITPTVTITPAGTVNAGSANTPITNIPPAMVTGITLIKT